MINSLEQAVFMQLQPLFVTVKICRKSVKLSVQLSFGGREGCTFADLVAWSDALTSKPSLKLLNGNTQLV